MRGLLMLALALQCAHALLAFSTAIATATETENTVATTTSEPSFWDFVVKDGVGKSIPLHDFKDSKAILIVNVASACGYTDQNYKELQALYGKYHGDGLQILGFPCNQFGGQEPHSEPQILKFVQEQYKVSFPILAKIDVNGANAHPLFQFLKTKLSGFVTNEIKWNFTKFLVVNGVPTKRYGTTTSPFQIESDIISALGLSSSPENTEL